MFCCFQDKQKQWNISCNHVLQQSHLQHVAVREICVSHWLRTLCVQDYEVRMRSCFPYLLRIQPSIPLSEVLSTLLWRQEYYRIWRFSTVQTSAGAHTVSYPIATGNPILVWWRGPSDRGVKVTTHFHLLRMRGTTHALLRASCRVA
jgi:hypothetical protein